MKSDLIEKIEKIEKLNNFYLSEIQKIEKKQFELDDNRRVLKFLIKENQKCNREIKSIISKNNKELRSLKTELDLIQSDINIEKITAVRARSNHGYIYEFLSIDEKLNAEEISKRFKLLGQPKQYKTIYKTLNDMIMKGIVKRFDSYTYTLNRDPSTEPTKMGLVSELANIHTTSNDRRLIEFFKIKNILNYDEITEMFLLIGKPQPAATITTLLEKLLNDGEIIKIENGSYKYVEKFKLKEMFYQGYDGASGIPNHWVVQYYTSDSNFPEAAYFKTDEEAEKFIENYCKTVDKLCKHPYN